MKKVKLIQIIYLFVSVSLLNLYGQTIHQVAAGENTLSAAVAGAAEGDIIELTSDGGIYNTSDVEYITINKALTIRAAAELSAKPILKNNYVSSSVRMFQIEGGGNLVLEGLEFDGTADDGVSPHVKNIVRNKDIVQADSFHTDYLRILNCDMHDVTEQFVKMHSWTSMDSMFIHNSTFYRAGKEGIVLYVSSSEPGPDIKYVEIENCTFAKTAREALYVRNNNPEIVINKCTFYDCGTSKQFGSSDNKRMIYPQGIENVKVTNSIFVKNTYDNFIKLYGISAFTNNIIWDVDNISTDGSDYTVSDTLRADPLFADPENYDFTLQDGSPALTYSSTGGAVGDRKWDPNASMPTVHKIEAGLNLLIDAIQAAAPNDIIELITSGGKYTYDIDDKMYVDKPLTIRAREGIAKKPVIKNIRSGSSNTRIFELGDGGSLTLIGLELDGLAEDGSGAYTKNGIRNENISSSQTLHNDKLKIIDCYFHDFTEPFIKLHAYTQLDTLLIENSIMKESGREGILIRESTSEGGCDLQYLKIVNTTIYNVKREALYSEFTDPETLIENCTFYNCGGTGDRILYPNGITNAVIRNSVFAQNGYSSVVKLYGNSSFSNSLLWNVPGISTDGDNTVISDTLTADPLFADAANGDFTLASDSPARTLSAAGGPVGDLRWAIDPNSVIVTVVTNGKGILSLNPAGGVYAPGTEVTLTAVADPGYYFDNWQGINVFPPDANPATITVNENITVTATFKTLTPQVTLAVDSIGLGGVMVTPEPGEEGTYDKGTVVTITAVPVENWKFVEWLGDVSGTTNPIQISLDSSMTVTASFASVFPQVKLNFQISGRGSVNVSPEPVLGTYDVNTSVTINAVAEAGWKFRRFTGHIYSSNSTETLKLDANKVVFVSFVEEDVEGGVLAIDDSWDYKTAVDYAMNNSQVNVIELTTSGGLYVSTDPSAPRITKPITIRAKDGLEKMPVIIQGGQNDDMFRVFDDFTLNGVELDGGHELSVGPKYAVRLSHMDDLKVADGTNVTISDCYIHDFFEDNDLNKDGHAFKIDVGVMGGDILIENTTIKSTGYEAIRISDTEKWQTEKTLYSLTVKNCTFVDIDAEAVRYYSDLLPETADAPVLLEHITVNNSATRAFYLKNSGGAVVRDIIISNTRQSGHGRDTDLFDCQGNTDVPSFVSDIVLFNTLDVPAKAADGEIDEETLWNIDPKYVDAANMDFTLSSASHLYGLGHDGSAIGDLRWATETPAHVAVNVTVTGQGSVEFDPMPVGRTFDPGQVVTVTAVADSGYEFISWGGDLSGSTNPIQLTVDAAKSVTANFDLTTGVDDPGIPAEFALDQNYPNPFNPSTTIRFALPVNAKVNIKVYNMLGQEVITLVDGQDMSAGYHNVVWYGSGNHDAELSSGVYVYRINAAGENGKEFVQTMKMMFLK